MRILVDRNILLRRAQPASPHHQSAFDAWVEPIPAGDEHCIVPQVVYEFWSVATRPANVNGLGMSVSQAMQSVQIGAAGLFAAEGQAMNSCNLAITRG